jgi:hypothetical protein
MSDDPRLKGMEVRYGGRSVKFDVFVFTAVAAARLRGLAERIRLAAAGERLDMTIVAAARGATARFDVFVNTDRTDDQLHVLVERIKQVARDEHLDIVVAAYRVEPEDAAPLWKMLIEGSHKQVAAEKKR